MSTNGQVLARAREFLYANARAVERALYEVAFEDADPARFARSLAAYQNADGGFGHALEPDLRAPASQPLATETALLMLRRAGVRRVDIADAACAFVAQASAPDCALPAFVPGALDYPAAAHWQAGFGAVPTLDRTCGIAALLAWHGARHEWLGRAIEACKAHIARSTSDEAHHLLYRAWFASIVLEGAARERALADIAKALPRAELFVPETPVARYGITPLGFAPRPDEPMRDRFPAASIEAHLDDLVRAQQGDGGWPIHFPPPSEGAHVEWRGYFTLEALLTLRAYERA